MWKNRCPRRTGFDVSEVRTGGGGGSGGGDDETRKETTASSKIDSGGFFPGDACAVAFFS